MNPSLNSRIDARSGAVLHDGVRPSWSSEVVSWLLGSPSADDQLDVLDLGAGTGLGTRTVAALGHTAIAVDTSAAMLSVLQQNCLRLPPDVAERITTIPGSAEQLPLEDQSVDAIICLQAWHWVDHKRAIRECDRVLRDGGTIGLAWHTWARSNKWVQALAAIVEPDGPAADQTLSVPAEVATRGAFERRNFPFTYELTVDQLVNLANSWSFVRERADHGEVLMRIRELGERAISPDTGLVAFPHVTAAFRLFQLPDGSRRH